LRDLHRARGREIELARGLLLQARGDERRRRRAPHLLALDLADDERLLLAGGDDLARLGLGQLVGLVIYTLVAMAVEASLEGRRIVCLQTRVERKLKEIDSKLHKMGAEASLVSVQDGHIHLKAHVDGRSCGSTARSVQAALEEAVYEAAPDLSSLKVEGLEEPSASGFVALDKLTAPPAPLHQRLTVSEGMD